MNQSARVVLTTIAVWLLSAALAFGQSSVNPVIPAQNAPLASAPVRSNFAAAYSDINGLFNMHAASSLAACSLSTQTVGADCLITSSSTAYAWYKYTGTNGYVLVGTINPSTVPPTFSAGLPPISNAQLIANCTGATAIPAACSWTAFANQAISGTNGNFPYRVGGIWGTASTGTSGHTIPFLDGSGIDFTNQISSGVAGSSVGGYCMANATTGSICLAPITGALGSSVATFPANTGVVAELNLVQTWSAGQTFQSGITVQSGLTVTGSFTATGLVTNADLVNSATTVNSQTCTLGATCTVTVPISTGVTGLGTGVAAFLATPNSANLATAITDETGTGLLVFAGSPVITTPTINSASLSGTFGGTFTISGAPSFTGLASGTCTNGVGINSAGLAITTACPGVSSSIQDGTTTIGGTAVASTVLYNNAGVLGHVTTGSAGQHLGVTGTSPTYKSGGWELVASVTANNTSGTLTDGGSALTTTYNEYEIEIDNIICATASQSLQLQVLIGGTPQTSGYNGQILNGNGSASGSQVLSTGIPLLDLSACPTTAPGASARLRVYQPAASGVNGKMFHGTWARAGNVGGELNGYFPSTSALSGIQINVPSNNLVSGSLRIKGSL